nr:heat stress transcription factor A-2-like [Ipomoea batatas]GMC96180.1 heat stress transcription factor A-2-like [Ipomoea batatas]GMD86482.1 heat stress transcription factor A-2-like [Ipomoea batatas]
MEVQVQHMMSDEGIAVKEEPMVFLVEDDGFGIPGVIGGGDGEMMDSFPRPLEGLREIGPPPFLKKTYDMVDDPNTDPVISWTPTRASFVVWDPHRLSTDVLPKYFKHNNFSSFIRQLNTYRFRKIDSDRWEFANEGFQKGKRHLLKSIKRRKHQHHHHHPQAMQQVGIGHKWVDSCNEAQAELCKLRNDQNLLKMEIMRLKQQQETTDNHLAMVRERLESTESRHKYIVFFVVKAFRNPFFIQHLTEKMRQRTTAINGGGGRVAKKRRLVAPESSTNAAAAAVDGKNLRGQEELVMLHSEIQTLFSSDDSSSPVQDQKVKTPAAVANSPEMNSENFILWEKLVEDDMIYENETEAETAKHQSAIVHELEDLIARPPEWGY